MVKVKKQSDKKMTEILERRRSSTLVSTHNLKRSKSVRESLRIIGTKFLHNHHHHHHNENQRIEVTKSPSLSDIHEQRDEDNNYSKYINNEVETILKTPMINNGKKPSKHHHLTSYLHFKRAGDILTSKKHEGHQLILTVPEVVAPKAAAILEIPSKENYVHLRHRVEDAIHEEDSYFVDKHQHFNRNSFRLSINTRRRNTMWSSFSSTSSMLICLFRLKCIAASLSFQFQLNRILMNIL